MVIKHNKKRNIGLINEFFIRHVSDMLLSEKQDEAKKAIDIYNKHFKEGSLLREELRLISALGTKIRTKEAAYRILKHIEEAVKKVNTKKLDYEKSMLIKDINYAFGSSFYEQRIGNEKYGIYASIQNLLNEYCGNGSLKNKTHIIKFEEDVVDYLMSEEKTINKFQVNQKNVYNRAIANIMNKKFTEKYAGKLNKSQVRIMQAYTKISNENPVEVMNEVRQDIRKLITKLKENKEILESKVAFDSLEETEKAINWTGEIKNCKECVNYWLKNAEILNEEE